MNSENWLKYDPGMDALSEKTQKLVDEAAKTTQELIKLTPQLSKTAYFTRGAHAKSYAFVKAKFFPEKNLIQKLGLEDKFFDGQDLLIRFSNANNVIGKESSDFPAYGMSLKFENNICYPLVNFPLFPSSDTDAVLKVFTQINKIRIAEAGEGKIISEIPALLDAALQALMYNPLDLGNLIWKGVKMEKDFLLNYSYHGIGCYRFGNYVARMHTEKLDFYFGKEEEEGSQAATLQQILNQKEIQFKIFLQMAVDEEETPVNILTKEWDTKDSPLLTFGIVKISGQQILQNADYLENMSFSPFLNEEMLQPVGRIQQTRKRVYLVSAETRNALNESRGNLDGNREIKINSIQKK